MILLSSVFDWSIRLPPDQTPDKRPFGLTVRRRFLRLITRPFQPPTEDLMALAEKIPARAKRA